MKKAGRPTDNPKKVSFNVRLDDESNKMMIEYMSKNKVSKAETIRRGIKKLYQDEMGEK